LIVLSCLVLWLLDALRRDFAPAGESLSSWPKKVTKEGLQTNIRSLHPTIKRLRFSSVNDCPVKLPHPACAVASSSTGAGLLAAAKVSARTPWQLA
jgi:hypothetical protein